MLNFNERKHLNLIILFPEKEKHKTEEKGIDGIALCMHLYRINPVSSNNSLLGKSARI